VLEPDGNVALKRPYESVVSLAVSSCVLVLVPPPLLPGVPDIKVPYPPRPCTILGFLLSAVRVP
jgi:hypothetical protein